MATKIGNETVIRELDQKNVYKYLGIKKGKGFNTQSCKNNLERNDF